MYQALYRKYRPRTFADVVGQKSVTDTLKAQLQAGRLSHAYLFTGTRGTGKTTCAKILAKAVNCEDLQDGDPCNVCPSCRAIDEGSCMDVLEIDAASNNGVDNVRTLRDEAIYTPSEVERRVYIIDEVHMLSMAAFNALLKIIEEPPPHLLFILATTEVHKIPATILSRCQRFSFRRLLPEDIEERLAEVAERERIDLEPNAAKLLARLADGALRDGLSLLDQCASAGGTLTEALVYERLGLAGNRQTVALLQAIAARETARAVGLFSTLYAQGKDVAAMLGELCGLARDLLILKTARKSGAALISPASTGPEAEALLEMLSAPELLRIVSLLQKTASGFGQSADKRLDAELCLLELCDPALRLDMKSLNARLGRLEQAVENGAVVQKVAVPPAPERGPEPPPEAVGPEAAPTARQPGAPPKDVLPPGFWDEVVGKVAPGLEPSAKSLLQRTEPVLQGDVLELLPEDKFVKSMIDKEPVLGPLRQAVQMALGRSVVLRVVERGIPGGDPFQKLLDFGAAHRDLVDIHEG